MSFLVRFTASEGDESLLHDELVVADMHALEAVEKELIVLGRRITLKLEFDPPLVPTSAQEANHATT